MSISNYFCSLHSRPSSRCPACACAHHAAPIAFPRAHSSHAAMRHRHACAICAPSHTPCHPNRLHHHACAPPHLTHISGLCATTHASTCNNMAPHDARMTARFASAGTAATLRFSASICGGNAVPTDAPMRFVVTVCLVQRSGALRRAADGVCCDSCVRSPSRGAQVWHRASHRASHRRGTRTLRCTFASVLIFCVLRVSKLAWEHARARARRHG